MTTRSIVLQRSRKPTDNINDVIAESPELIRAIANSLAAIVKMDGQLTIYEWEALLQSIGRLSEISDNSRMSMLLVLNGLLNPIILDDEIRKMKQSIKVESLSEGNRSTILNVFIPIIEIQAEYSNRLLKLVGKALYISDSIMKEFQENIAFERSEFSAKTITNYFKKPKDIVKIKHIASIYQDNNLLDLVNTIECSESHLECKERLNDLLRNLNDRIIESIDRKLSEESENIKQIESFQQALLSFKKLLEQQLDERIHFIIERANQQCFFFQEDFDAFLNSAVDSVDQGLRDICEGRADWDDPAIWKRFGETDAAIRIQNEFNKLKSRYDKLFDLWNKELEAFSQESRHTSTTLFPFIESDKFSGLVNLSMGTRVLKAMDIASSATLTTAAIAGGTAALGTGVLIYTGILTAASIGSAAFAIVSNPVGWGVGAIVAGAAVWKIFQRRESRKLSKITDKRKDLRERIKDVFGNPVEVHNDKMQQIINSFCDIAELYFTQIFKNILITTSIPDMQRKVLQKIKNDTIKAFESISIENI